MPQASFKHVSRGASWNYTAHASAAVTGLVVTALATRTLGTELFGVYVVIATITGLLPLIDFGMRAPVTVAASQTDHFDGATRDEARRTFLSGHALYILIGTFGASILILGGLLAHLAGIADGDIILAALLTGLGMAFSVSMAAMGALCISALRFKQIALWTLAGQAAYVTIVVLSIDRWGLPALGLGQLLHAVISKLPLALWAYRSTEWLNSLWTKPTRPGISRLGRIALPAFVLAVSGQVVSTTDVFILTAVVGPIAVGAYKVGVVIPTQAIGFLYRGIDVIFPILAGTDDRSRQERLVWQVTTASCAVAGLAMGLLLLLRQNAIVLLTGSASTTSETVLLLFALAWLANVPSHALALLIVARNHQSRIVPVVVIEAVTNLGLTLVMVPRMGAVGAALATLLTLAVSNLLILPVVLRNEVAGSCLLRVWGMGVCPALWGLTPAILLYKPLGAMPPSNRAWIAFVSVASWALLFICVGYVVRRCSSRRLRQFEDLFGKGRE